MRALLLTALCLSAAFGFAPNELSSRVYGACDAPPVDLILLLDRSANFYDAVPKALSLAHTLILRSGCARNSSFAVVTSPSSAADATFGDASLTGLQRTLLSLSTTSPSSSNLEDAFHKAGALFSSHRTLARGARGVILYVTATTDMSVYTSKLAATSATLQHEGLHIAAVIPAIASDLAETDWATSSSTRKFHTLRRAVTGLVSAPPTRNVFFAFTASGSEGSVMDLALPFMQPLSNTASLYDFSLPLDPRSVDPCVSPHTCVVSAGGWVRAFTGESYQARQHGEFVLASYRSSTHGAVDILGGLGKCPHTDDGNSLCLIKLTIAPRDAGDDFFTIRATATGAMVSSNENGFAQLNAGTEDFTAYSRDSILQIHHARMAPTWQPTAAAAANGNASAPAAPISSFAITVRTGSLASSRIQVDVDNGVLSVMMIVGADTTPTRVGLCGAPAGAIGDEAAPADRQPRHVRFAGGAADSDALEVAAAAPVGGEFAGTVSSAHAGATSRRRCPPASAAYRLLDASEDGIARLHAHARLTDADFAHLETLERVARDNSGTSGNRDAFVSRVTSRIYGSYRRGTDTLPSPTGHCKRAFGTDAHLGKMCQSIADTSARGGVYTALRTAVTLCRIRCLAPDSARVATYSVVAGVSGSGAQRATAAGTEILDDLVAPGWCEENVCELLTPRLPDNKVDYVLNDRHDGHSILPAWFILSQRAPGDALDHLKSLRTFSADEGKVAVFTPPQGGNYTLRAYAYAGKCGEHTTNVSVVARCARVLDTPYAGENVTVERVGGSFPYVSLHGLAPVLSGVAVPPKIDMWWSVDGFPESPVEGYDASGLWTSTAGVTIIYPRSNTAIFQPPHAGEWVISFSVFDGCAVRTAFVSVKAICGGSCKPSVRVDAPTFMLGSKTSLGNTEIFASFTQSPDGNYDNMGGNHAWRSFNVTFPASPYVAVSGDVPSIASQRTALESSAGHTSFPDEFLTAVTDPIDRLKTFLSVSSQHTTDPVLTGYRAKVGAYGSGNADSVSRLVQSGPVRTTSQCALQDNTDYSYPISHTSSSSSIDLDPLFPQVDNTFIQFADYIADYDGPDVDDIFEAALPDVCATGASKYRIPAAMSTGRLPAYAYGEANVSSWNVPGLVFSSYNAAQSPSCAFGNKFAGSVWYHTTRQPTTYRVGFTYEVPNWPFPDSYNLTGDGLRFGTIRVEYRMLTIAAVSAASWKTTDVSDASGTWVVATAEEFGVESERELRAIVPGPSVVRLTVELNPHRITHVLVRNAYIHSDLLIDTVKCRGNHIRGKVSATDGCSVVNTSFETSFGCALPPQIALTTPHVEIEYDYSAQQWPAVPLSGFYTTTDGIKLQLGAVGITSPSTSAIVETAAYEFAPGYAHATLTGTRLGLSLEPSWSGSVLTAQACAITSSSISPWSMATNTDGRGVRSFTPAAAAAVNAGPARPTPDATKSISIFPSCFGKGTHTLHRVINLDSGSSSVGLSANITHVNVTFFVHAFGVASWRVHAGSYAATSEAGILPDTETATVTFGSTAVSRRDAWVPAHVIVPIISRATDTHSSSHSRYAWIAVTFEHTVPAILSAMGAARSHISVSGFKLAPAFLSKNSPKGSLETVAVLSEGVARFAVTQSSSCHTTSAFMDVRATCKYSIGAQKVALYQSAGAGPKAVVADTTNAALGTKTIRGVPTGPAEVVVVIPDGVAVGERGATWKGKAYGLVRRGTAVASAVAPHVFDAAGQYGPMGEYTIGNTKPWDTSSTIVSADLLGGVYGRADVDVVAAGAGEVEVRATDGCRWNTQVVPVTFACSDTTWTGATAIVKQGSTVIAVGDKVASGATVSIEFDPKAMYAALQPDGTVATTRTDVSSSAIARVEIVSITPTAGKTLSIAATGSTQSPFSVNDDGVVNGWLYRANNLADFVPTGAGTVRVRVSYFFESDCSAPAAPIEVDIAVAGEGDCALKAAVAPAAGATKFVKRVDVTFVSYTAADFTAVGNAKNKDAIMGYLNGASSPLGAHATVADAEYTTMLQLKLAFKDSSTDFATVGDFIKKDLAFQRLFGEVSSVAAKATTQGAVAATYTFTGTGTAPTLTALTLQTTGLSFADITICSGNCPAFSGTTLTVPVDLYAHAQYPNAPATGRLWTGLLIPTWSAAVQPSYCDVPTPLMDVCSFMSNTAIAPRGAVGLVDGPAVADATATPAAPGRIVYAKDEPRAFQRVYLIDATALPDYSYANAQNLAAGTTAGYTPPTFKYEWWVAEAPAASIYAPVWKNVSLKGSSKSPGSSTMYYTSAYAVTATSPMSAFITAEGSPSVVLLSEEETSEGGMGDFEASFYRIGNDAADCLRSSAIPRNPRGEACWTPDVPGAYKLFYRARMTSCAARLGGDADGWVSDTIAFNAECPAFSAVLGGAATTTLQLSPTDNQARVNVTVDIAGSALVDHIRPVWVVDRVSGPYCSSSAYAISDDSDLSASVTLLCPGRYNISAVVTDGCTLKTLTRMYDVNCTGAADLARYLPNTTIDFAVPEGGDIGTYATIEVPIGSSANVAALEATGICSGGLGAYWQVVDYVPHNDTVVASAQSYKATRASGSDALLTGAAADLRLAGRTTDGDVLATIMAFAIGAAVIIVIGIAITLFAVGGASAGGSSMAAAAASSGTVFPSEPATAPPAASYGDAPSSLPPQAPLPPADGYSPNSGYGGVTGG